MGRFARNAGRCITRKPISEFISSQTTAPLTIRLTVSHQNDFNGFIHRSLGKKNNLASNTVRQRESRLDLP
jgi:hypothetical protein